ncbi:MAG: hypothetical protein B0W54_19055 [Cellvibrio sp. 79]|nr:MAG: hypothetical protein B0W54_19055 [Cellvibrio sp. 79]
MKYLLRSLVFGISCLLALASYGHEGHEHGPVSIKAALEIGLKAVKNYSIKPSPFVVGQLPASWASLTEDDAKIHENKIGYYIVRVENMQEKQTVYLKILLDGTIKDANYTGIFTISSAKSSSPPTSGS